MMGWPQRGKKSVKGKIKGQTPKTGMKKTLEPLRFQGLCWRGRRDLNPRTVLPAYSLSRGAPSATWVLPRVENIEMMKLLSGGESGIRTHGPCGSPVFKTGSLNHSDISPNWNPSKCKSNLSISQGICQRPAPHFYQRYCICGLPGRPSQNYVN